MNYIVVLMALMVNAEGVVSVSNEVIDVKCDKSTGCHIIPYFFADTSGGFVAAARSRSNPPRFTLNCGGDGITGISKILTPDANRLVIQEFGPLDPDMYCNGNEVKSNRISGLKDGGWFWITRGSQVAVAPLLSSGVLRNRRVRFADPGFGVTMDRRGYVTLIEEHSTGRLIMMLNVMPEPEPPPPDICGPVTVKVDDDIYEYRQLLSDCIIGDGGTYIQFSEYGIAGTLVPITEGVINRPFSGEYAIDLSLWLNETGSINSGPDPTIGWNSIAGASPLEVTNWSIQLNRYHPGTTLASAGVDAGNLGEGYFNIKASEEHCSESNRHSVTITARAFVAPDANPISPPPRASRSDQSAATSNLTIVCPAPAAQNSGGVELVPSTVWKDN